MSRKSACPGIARYVVHGIPGGNYGYRNGTGKYPQWYIDSLPPLRDLDRGSPVGVETYQSYAYPPQDFDMLLEADWSRGRLLYTTLDTERRDLPVLVAANAPEFVHGEPLNMTDLEVGPDGDDLLHDRRPRDDRRLLAHPVHRALPPQPDRPAFCGCPPAAAVVGVGLGAHRAREGLYGRRRVRRGARRGRAPHVGDPM